MTAQPLIPALSRTSGIGVDVEALGGRSGWKKEGQGNPPGRGGAQEAERSWCAELGAGGALRAEQSAAPPGVSSQRVPAKRHTPPASAKAGATFVCPSGRPERGREGRNEQKLHPGQCAGDHATPSI